MEEQSKNKISEEEKQLHGKPGRRKGGLITMPFIFGMRLETFDINYMIILT